MGRIGLASAVSRNGSLDAFDVLEDSLNTPEASSSDDHRLLTLSCRKRSIYGRVRNLDRSSSRAAAQHAYNAGYGEGGENKSGHLSLLPSNGVSRVTSCQRTAYSASDCMLGKAA